jgi:hypothetical protein
MSNKEGTLRMMASRRWAIYRPGQLPVEITSGELFRVKFAGQLKLTRMEYSHDEPGGYYSVDGYPLRDVCTPQLASKGESSGVVFSTVRCLSWSCSPRA